MNGDCSQTIDDIINKLKREGRFDQFRKECLADVDTKPAFQNLQHRVEQSVRDFLRCQKWRSDLNKNQLRNTLRKHINSKLLTSGIDRVVDQVVTPKIDKVFKPQIDQAVCDFLGIDLQVWKKKLQWRELRRRRAERQRSMERNEEEYTWNGAVPSLLQMDVSPQKHSTTASVATFALSQGSCSSFESPIKAALTPTNESAFSSPTFNGGLCRPLTSYLPPSRYSISSPFTSGVPQGFRFGTAAISFPNRYDSPYSTHSFGSGDTERTLGSPNLKRGGEGEKEDRNGRRKPVKKKPGAPEALSVDDFLNVGISSSGWRGKKEREREGKERRRNGCLQESEREREMKESECRNRTEEASDEEEEETEIGVVDSLRPATPSETERYLLNASPQDDVFILCVQDAVSSCSERPDDLSLSQPENLAETCHMFISDDVSTYDDCDDDADVSVSSVHTSDLSSSFDDDTDGDGEWETENLETKRTETEAAVVSCSGKKEDSLLLPSGETSSSKQGEKWNSWMDSDGDCDESKRAGNRTLRRQRRRSELNARRLARRTICDSDIGEASEESPLKAEADDERSGATSVICGERKGVGIGEEKEFSVQQVKESVENSENSSVVREESIVGEVIRGEGNEEKGEGDGLEEEQSKGTPGKEQREEMFDSQREEKEKKEGPEIMEDLKPGLEELKSENVKGEEEEKREENMSFFAIVDEKLIEESVNDKVFEKSVSTENGKEVEIKEEQGESRENVGDGPKVGRRTKETLKRELREKKMSEKRAVLRSHRERERCEHKLENKKEEKSVSLLQNDEFFSELILKNAVVGNGEGRESDDDVEVLGEEGMVFPGNWRIRVPDSEVPEAESEEVIYIIDDDDDDEEGETRGEGEREEERERKKKKVPTATLR